MTTPQEENKAKTMKRMLIALCAMMLNKIIFVSLGSFNKPFQKKDYIITGSVYKQGYKYDLMIF